MGPCERNTLQQPIEKLSGTDRVNVASGYVHTHFDATGRKIRAFRCSGHTELP